MITFSSVKFGAYSDKTMARRLEGISQDQQNARKHSVALSLIRQIEDLYSQELSAEKTRRARSKQLYSIDVFFSPEQYVNGLITRTHSAGQQLFETLSMAVRNAGSEELLAVDKALQTARFDVPEAVAQDIEARAQELGIAHMLIR